LKFERADWTSFRTVEGLQQKAGVPAELLIRLVLKELADNALDAGASVEAAQTRGGYFVEDDGPGIDGTPEEIARLFSISRPLVSTKLLRLPTRGALGNGLRVVAGAVLASNGSLVVITKGRRSTLRPERDGSTAVVGVKPSGQTGTRIERSASVRKFLRMRRTPWSGPTSRSSWRTVRPIRAGRRHGGTTARTSTNCWRQAAWCRCGNWWRASMAAQAHAPARLSRRPS
jgi:hypothetical protein